MVLPYLANAERCRVAKSWSDPKTSVVNVIRSGSVENRPAPAGSTVEAEFRGKPPISIGVPVPKTS